MDQTKYFFQGFLFIFGLSSVPFSNEVISKNKISTYWESVSLYIQKAFNGQNSK
jgi:hypothetical protein